MTTTLLVLEDTSSWAILEGLSAASKDTQTLFRKYLFRTQPFHGPSIILAHMRAVPSYQHFEYTDFRRFWRFHFSWYQISDRSLLGKTLPARGIVVNSMAIQRAYFYSKRLRYVCHIIVVLVIKDSLMR